MVQIIIALQLLFAMLDLSAQDNTHGLTDADRVRFAEHLSVIDKESMKGQSLVSDEATAVGIAECVAKSLYGGTSVEREQPFKAFRPSRYWIVLGTLKNATSGGTIIAKVDRKTGAVIYLGRSM